MCTGQCKGRLELKNHHFAITTVKRVPVITSGCWIERGKLDEGHDAGPGLHPQVSHSQTIQHYIGKISRYR